jgi:class 3 adenylate cyclase/CHAT domain-containing protein/cytochrome c-type biogenesis protein CcmH/NrfG
MAANKTADGGCHTSQLEKILLERERLEQVLKDQFHKMVTIFFSDVCGYTQYTDKRGDIQSRTLLLKHNRIVLPAIEMHKGKVIEIVGDGIMAAFDDPVDAAKAAIEVQKKLKTYNDKTTIDDQIHVKIGINNGDTLMDEGAAYQSLSGDVANVAARIQSQAQKDQILLSRSVYEQTRSCNDFLIRFHANIQVKGKNGDIPIYRLIWKDDETVFDQAANVRMHPEGTSSAKRTATILNLDLNIEGHQLKVSVNEACVGEKSTISRYETIPISLDAVDKRCRHIVDTLNKANRRGRVSRQVLVKLREIGQVLYDELLTFNVKEVLRSSRSDTLIIKIDDQLVRIPWELLYDGQQFLCLRFNMGRVVKTRQTVASAIRRKLEQPLGMLILADPTGDLKGAYAEGMQIRDFMDQSPDKINVSLRSSDATAENIKTKLRNFDIVHFAGHSDYDIDCPETSGWRLHGGSLCTGDITKMAGSATMPAMIFANACQSARTDAWTLEASFESKIFGLANAFLVAGVKHYIGTFWEVPDKPSSRFAIEFYKHLFADLSVGEALRKARQTLIELYGEETIIWASYVLYGDPTFDYMAHLRMESTSAQLTGAPKRARPFEKERTREEVIDFSEGRVRHPAIKWLALVLLVLLSAGLLLIGRSWIVNHGVEKMEQQAMAFYLSGDNDAAAALSRQVQRDIPGSPISSLILGNIYFSRGDRDTAKRYFQSATDSGKGSKKIQSEALMGLARLSSIAQEPEQALQLYQRADTVDPQSTRALTAQAIILDRQNRDAEALLLYQQALERSPNDFGIQVAVQDIRERLSWQQDQEKQARIDQLVQKLLERDPGTIASVDDENRWTSKPLSVWLMDFEEAGFGIQEGQGHTVHILLRELLTKNPRVKMVERAVLDKLLTELHLGSSQLAERQTSLAIGRLMAARVLLPGQIQYEGGQALVSIRAIECETGLINASVVESYDRSKTPMDIAQDMARRIAESLTAAFPIRTRVSEVNGNQIVLDVGQRAGVQTGQVLAGVDADVTLQVTSVDDNRSTATVLRGEHAIAAGFRLQEKNQDASTSID